MILSESLRAGEYTLGTSLAAPRKKQMTPFVHRRLEARAQIFHLVLVARCRIPGRAASSRCTAPLAVRGQKRDVDMKVVRLGRNLAFLERFLVFYAHDEIAAALRACEAAETMILGSFSSFWIHEARYNAEFSKRTESRIPVSFHRNAAPSSAINSSLE